MIIAIALLLAFTASCEKKADFDLRNTDTYSAIVKLIDNHAEYSDKTVRIKGESSVVYNFSANSADTHVICGESEGKTAYYEIKSADGKYPLLGSHVSLFGTVTASKQISVDEFSDAQYDDITYDIDTLSMSAADLRSFIEDYNAKYQNSEHYGKTIRIFGHCESSYDALKWLLGLDENGSVTWDIELYDPTGEISYPTQTEKTVNAVEVIGKLSTYESNGITYACIEVERVIKVQSVFK
jgi:hypothetical protein